MSIDTAVVRLGDDTTLETQQDICIPSMPVPRGLPDLTQKLIGETWVNSSRLTNEFDRMPTICSIRVVRVLGKWYNG